MFLEVQWRVKNESCCIFLKIECFTYIMNGKFNFILTAMNRWFTFGGMSWHQPVTFFCDIAKLKSVIRQNQYTPAGAGVREIQDKISAIRWHKQQWSGVQIAINFGAWRAKLIRWVCTKLISRVSMYKKREKSPESRTLPQGVVRVNWAYVKI